MELVRLINEYLILLSSLIGLIVWLVRLESKISSCEKHLDRIEKKTDVLEFKHEQLDTKLVRQLADVREALARIEGALGVNVK